MVRAATRLVSNPPLPQARSLALVLSAVLANQGSTLIDVHHFMVDSTSGKGLAKFRADIHSLRHIASASPALFDLCRAAFVDLYEPNFESTMEVEEIAREFKAVKPNTPTFIIDGITFMKGPTVVNGIPLGAFISALSRGLIFTSAAVQFTQVVLGRDTDTPESILKTIEGELDQLVQVVSTRVGKGPHPARPLYSEVTIEEENGFLITQGKISHGKH